MTTRKPGHVWFPDWVEGQIVAAQRAGAFDNLPGKGKPIPGLGRPRHELEWVANYLRREDVAVAGVLPPQLALAKEVEDLSATVAKLHSEAAVRSVVTDLNNRIRAAQRAPQDGPRLRVGTVDADAVVRTWREAQAVRMQPRQGQRPAQRRERRWFRRTKAG
jgi:Domain of unknown function (DUF1992)